MKNTFIIERDFRDIKVKLKDKYGTILSMCKISISPIGWSIASWYTNKDYLNQGYGKQVLKEAVRVLYDADGMPDQIRYNWDGDNSYVFDWLSRNFSAECIDEFKRKDDTFISHIYKLDRDKFLRYCLTD